MSASLFKMLFGLGEGTLPEPGPRHTAAQADGIALGLAMKQHGHNDQSAARCDMLIAEQANLLQLQAVALLQEQPLRVAHLRSLLQESKSRRTAQRLRTGVIALAALVSVMIGVAIIAVLYGALTSNSVVVEAFDTPDVLSEKGLSSKVLANALLDNLTRLQAATRTKENSRNVTWAWANDIKIELPRTGVSLGDLERILRAHLGRDIHIQGDIVLREGGTLALSMRGDGVMPKTFTSNFQDLDKVIMQAAEYIYGAAEPARYAGYLVHVGRNADAIAFSRDAYAAASEKKRPGILNAWANAIVGTGGPLENAKVLYVEALRLQPDYWLAYSNLANLYITKGEEEEVWRLGRDMVRKAGGRPGRATEFDYTNIDQVTWNLQAWRTALYENVRAYRGVGSGTVAEEPQIADVDVRLHDVDVASLMLQTVEEGNGNDPSIEALRHFVRGRLATEAGESVLAATEMEAFGIAFNDPVVAGNYAGFNCWLAPAEEAVGRHAAADQAIQAGGHYVDCYRFRADILDARGDWPAAQKAYEAAVALAPDLPAAYYSWGLALARHGDYQGAKAKLKEAVERGPHWADPQKALGDIEAAEGRWPQALAYFTAALDYAPAWRELQLSRDAALKHQKPS